MTILITGAAGNLGSRLAAHLLAESAHDVRLLVHRTPPPDALIASLRVRVFRGDLDAPETLAAPCRGADCVVHLAGRLFAPRPETFLPVTNVRYVRHLLAAARQEGVRRFVLVSFPHVEGETTPDRPARERMDGRPSVVHFRTRLEAEQSLFETCRDGGMTPVVLRAGAVYGKGVKMVEAARRLLRYRLLAVWNEPTWFHLISLTDFLRAVTAACEVADARGIYNVCDAKPLTLQEILDRLADHWGYPRPYRLPRWCFFAAATFCEVFALLFGTTSPLTRDFVRGGMVSFVADTSRMRRELLPTLAHPTLDQGIGTL